VEGTVRCADRFDKPLEPSRAVLAPIRSYSFEAIHALPTECEELYLLGNRPALDDLGAVGLKECVLIHSSAANNPKRVRRASG
jgi:hypothetical protein